jgi:hypothetical protein
MDSSKAFGLIDAMAEESKEFVVLTCVCMESKKHLAKFLTELFKHSRAYRDSLSGISELSRDISVARESD